MHGESVLAHWYEKSISIHKFCCKVVNKSDLSKSFQKNGEQESSNFVQTVKTSAKQKVPRIGLVSQKDSRSAKINLKNLELIPNRNKNMRPTPNVSDITRGPLKG